MADLLADGKEFKSFAALQDAVHKYEQTCFAQLSRTDSRTIENEEQRKNTKHFNPAIKYSFVTFTCAFGGKPYVSRSTGIRNSKPRIKCNCPVVLKCFASSDGQKLVVRQSQLDCHNHETTEESFKTLPRGRLLDEETELEIFNLIEMHENKKLARKLIKEKLIEETGRDISYKDIQNIEKRMSRKRDKERNGEEYDENEELEDDDDVQKDTDHEEEEDKPDENEKGDDVESKDVKAAENGTEENKTDEEPTEDKSKPEVKTEASPSNNAVKSKTKQSQGSVKKTPGRKPKQVSSRPSVGRPRREIREPSRFRDAIVVNTPITKKRCASESGNEESGEESADSHVSTKKDPPSPPKVKKPGAKRGRKPLRKPAQEESEEESETEPKAQKKEAKAEEVKTESSNTSRDAAAANKQMLEMEERRLKMQEEMLELQRQSILLLQNVVQRLDKVEEGQKELKAT